MAFSRNGPFPQSQRQTAEFLVRRTNMYVSAQFLVFLDLAKNCSFRILKSPRYSGLNFVPLAAG